MKGQRVRGEGGLPAPVGTAERPVPGREIGWGPIQADSRPSLQAALQSRKRGRSETTAVPAPRRPPGTSLTRVPAQLVSEHVTRLGVALQNEDEVGPADPAVGDLDEHLTRSGNGDGQLLNFDLPSPM